MVNSADRAGTDDRSQSYIIVGAGVFGASTALQLKRTKPKAKVILIDRMKPNPAAASSDLNKIIRADYPDLFYMKLALEALEAWKGDPFYKPYFHRTGMLFAEDKGRGEAFNRNYAALGIHPPGKLMSVEEARYTFPSLANGNWQGVKQAYYNPASGWGDADMAMRAVVDAAIDAGVQFHAGSVEELLLRRSTSQTDVPGRCILQCTGVRLESGAELQANHIVLCTGAATAKLLADSAPTEASFQAAGRLVAAAAVSCTVRVDPTKRSLYRDAPVFANLMAHTSGEAIPLNDEGLLKFNCEKTFTKNEHHSESNQILSNAHESVSDCTWRDDIIQSLKEEIFTVIRGTYGHLREGLEVQSYRICWDAITKSQDWIIAPHDACSNLFVATGGSFHAWKFLPVLGSNVTDMLDGKLSPEKARRWAWSIEVPDHDGACESYIPKRDMKDFKIPSDKFRPRV